MPVHDLGFRGWTGRLTPDWTRGVVITTTGVRRAWGNRWLKRMLLFAWLPAMWFAFGFFLYEQSFQYNDVREPLALFLRGMPETAELGAAIGMESAEDSRHIVWSWLLHSFFRYPQAVVMVLVVGAIAPGAISQDIRSRAFLLYFSRPLTRTEYILGKAAVIWIYLALIATAPALVLYVLGVLLSPEFVVVESTWELPLRILAASAVLMIPTASLALCLSSLTQESRYAGFAWFAIWILGWFTYVLLSSIDTVQIAQQNGRLAHGDGELAVAVMQPANYWWAYLSLYHTMGMVESWIFGFDSFRDIWVAALILVLITVVSTAVLFRRVAAPMRI